MPKDNQIGLYPKFEVKSTNTGEIVGDCFVLRPDRDPAAIEAILAYAQATENKQLQEDLIEWVHSLSEPAPGQASFGFNNTEEE